MPFRQRRMTENEFLLIECVNVAKGVEIGNMKHEKEWHTCDRCGEEIDKLPSQKHFFCKKIVSPTELKMMCDEKYGYLGDTHLITEDVVSVTIVECHDVETRRFDLCPKCRKDFERFMKNE